MPTPVTAKVTLPHSVLTKVDLDSPEKISQNFNKIMQILRQMKVQLEDHEDRVTALE